MDYCLATFTADASSIAIACDRGAVAQAAFGVFAGNCDGVGEMLKRLKEKLKPRAETKTADVFLDMVAWTYLEILLIALVVLAIWLVDCGG